MSTVLPQPVPLNRQKSLFTTLFAYIVSLVTNIRFDENKCDAGDVLGTGPLSILSPWGNEFGVIPSEGNIYPEGSLNDGRSIPQRCVTLNNEERCYYSYVPECASGPTPVVIDMHFGSTCPSTHIQWTGFLELAEEKCFAVMWPESAFDSVLPFWKIPGGAVDPNDPTNVAPDFNLDIPGTLAETVAPADTLDYDFVREMGQDFVKGIEIASGGKATLNTKRFYATGLSMGCLGSITLAMIHSDFLAAVACFGGTWMTAPAENYIPTPILEFHGERDILIPFNGGPVLGLDLPFDISPDVFSVQTTFDGLSAVNNCSGTIVEEIPVPEMDLSEAEGMVTIQTATGCEDGAEVKSVVFNTAGHIVIGGVTEVTPTVPFAASTTIDTTLMAWEFMDRFQLEQAPF